MKIHLAKYEPERIGGGWTFMRNFAKGMKGDLTSYEEADIYFISSPSIVSRDEVFQAKKDGKKILLRVDNAVRNSRNRNTGMSRMFDFAQLADVLVYQSRWAQRYLQPFLGKKGSVILNGIDLALYKPPTIPPNRNFVFYSRFNRDETKNWEVARYWFSQFHMDYPDSKLYIAGQFSQELRDGNFDFYMGEDYQFLGVLPPEELAAIYRYCHKFLYTYYNDACSNSLIEALCSDCEIVGGFYYQDTGGSKEIIDLFARHGRQRFSIDFMCAKYKEVLAAI
jgi:hypothetical protein